MRFADVIHLSAAGFPADARHAPADFATYAPMGNGVFAAGLPAMPWGAAPSNSPGYALYAHNWEPLLGAPVSEGSGGVVYFDRHTERSDFDAVLRVLGVGGHVKTYLAYVEDATDVGKQRFATQLRIVSAFATKFLYKSSAAVPEQALSIGDAMWRFVELEMEHTGKLRGTLGGDGDWASEHVGFGLLVENSYYGVHRIWSRPWLVTK